MPDVHSPSTVPRLRTVIALRCALAVFLAGLLAACALLWVLTVQFHTEAQAGQQAIARSIAQTLVNQTARAIRLGVPLDKLPSVEDYLQQTIDNTPQLAYLALADQQGHPLYSASQGKAERLETLPVIIRGVMVAQVQAGASSTPSHSMVRPAIWALLTTLLASALAGALAWLWPGQGLQKRHALLLQALRSTDSVIIQEREAADAQQAALQALSLLQQRNLQLQQAKEDFASELLAVDFDQKMHAAIADIAPEAIKSGVSQ